MFGLNFGKKKGKGKKSAGDYATEFMDTYDAEKYEEIPELLEVWMFDFPNDANAQYAQGIFIGGMVSKGKVSVPDALNTFDEIQQKVSGMKSADRITGHFLKKLFETYHQDLKKLLGK